MSKLNSFLLLTKLRAQQAVNAFWEDEQGDTNIISIVIILVIVVGLAAIFRTQIIEFVQTLWARITAGMTQATAPLQ